MTNELMINDLVMCKHTKALIKIKGYTEDTAELIELINGSTQRVCESLNEYVPIPLTPEILEKNGFEYDHSFHTWIYDEFTINHGYLIEEDYNEHLFVWVADVHVVITYVHELQHALRLCGMNGLADNFKI